MQRDARAYLAAGLEPCDAIAAAIVGVSLEAYPGDRLVRSSLERECTIIAEAVLEPSHTSPATFDHITGPRRMVDVRHRLRHAYPIVGGALVWALAQQDMRLLRGECAASIAGLEADAAADQHGVRADSRRSRLTCPALAHRTIGEHRGAKEDRDRST